MVTITVGYVAGIIAAVIFVCKCAATPLQSIAQLKLQSSTIMGSDCHHIHFVWNFER
jgi:hypothetical protein